MSSTPATQPNDDSFASDPRKQQEDAGRPLALAIYKQVWGDALEVDYQEGNDLDRMHGIDCIVRLQSGLILTVQEKFLSHEFIGFNSLTIEYEQNQHTGEPGDWHSLKAQFYMASYFNKANDAFEKWVLVRWPELVLLMDNGKIKVRDNANKDGKARASFKYVLYSDIPDSCLVASHGVTKLAIVQPTRKISDADGMAWLEGLSDDRIANLINNILVYRLVMEAAYDVLHDLTEHIVRLRAIRYGSTDIKIKRKDQAA